MKHPLLLAASLAVTLLHSLLPAQSSGAVYTTDSQGQEVNLNVFDNARKVYLGGGPGVNTSCSFQGLEDGDYYFQITTTSGGTLLTTDSINNRRVTVVGGVFAIYAGSRRTTSGPCNSVLIQLAPFSEPPSGSQQYKVWVTKVEDYDPALSGSFGFRSSDSKTDNFKVRGRGRATEQTAIRGTKFFDYNGNGSWDGFQPEEVPIPGWRIELRQGGTLVEVTFTDEFGAFEFLRERNGVAYEVVEVPPEPGFIPAPGARWHPTTSVARAVLADQETVDVGAFGNISFTDEPVEGLSTSKGFWHNAGEPLLRDCDPLWRETVNGPVGDPLCLRRPISSPDPAISIFTVGLPPTSFEDAFGDLADYLVGNPALGHAGFILSVQVCAAVLNRSCGPLSTFGLIAIDPRGGDELILFEDLVAGAQALLCDPRAGQTMPGENEDLRAQLLGCTNEFEQINSSGGGSIHTPTNQPSNFESPYGDLL